MPLLTPRTTPPSDLGSTIRAEGLSPRRGLYATYPPTEYAMNLLQIAHDYLAAGLSVLPASKVDKMPTVSWSEFQTRPPKPEELSRLLASRKADALCLVTGEVSGNLEMIDFDFGAEFYDAWAAQITPELLSRLVVECSQSGGKHVVYRCTEVTITGNKKLAKGIRPDKRTGEPKPQGIIETRGEGGIFLCAPTPGYEVIAGDLTDLPAITADERDELISVACGLTEITPRPDSDPRPKINGGPASGRPGDDYTERGDVDWLLNKHGWTKWKTEGKQDYWRRPGKLNGNSATFHHEKRTFFCFTCNADPLEETEPYTPFKLRTFLEHAGDYAACARELRREGYGDAPAAAAMATPPLVAYAPFPTDTLPDVARRFTEEGAAAIGCDPSLIALPLLTAAGAAIGNTRRLQIKHTWLVPPILWSAIVGESGTQKTPAFRLVMQAVKDRQEQSLEHYAATMETYAADRMHYEKQLAQWKKDKGDDDPPQEPHEPVTERYFVTDTTVEALAPILSANPRGLLLSRDELAGWFGSFDRHAGGKGGSDAANWLSMYNGETITVDRKTGTPKTISVPMAAVCITGGIQPGILRRALGDEHRESGLAARFMLAYPPRKVKRWTDADIDPFLESSLANVMERLYTLESDKDESDRLKPRIVGLTPDARISFIDNFNLHAQEQAELTGDMAAAWSKLEETPARLAMVFQFLEWAGIEPPTPPPDSVDLANMNAAIRLTEWCKTEAKRTYAMLTGIRHAG